jgi:hypothetical protein
MAANTGPDVNTYPIPEVELGDTFNVWKDITNTGVYKLNKVRVYEGISTSDVVASTDSSGKLSLLLAPTIPTGHTFSAQMSFGGQVVFGSGVTFNGPVTFNADSFTVNANIVTIDDYNILLGDTAAASDANISVAGGGGLLIRRGSGNTAEWLWTPTNLHGITGIWTGDGHIGFKGNASGIYPNAGGNLLVHGTGIRLDGGTTTEHGLLVGLGGSGTTTGRTIQFSRYSPAGSTAFIDVTLRTPPNPNSSGTRPYVSVSDGANKKTVTQTSHSLTVGTPVRLNPATGRYEGAKADTADNAEVIGVVSRVIGGNEFELTFMGEVFDINFSQVTVEGSAGITGAVYYLSPYVQGKLTLSYPTLVDTVHKGVLIATSSSSGVVVPWTGGVLSQAVVLGESTSNTIRITQLNQFRVGDVIRFDARSGGANLSYGSGAGATSAYYPHGLYVRADARVNSGADNIAGMVVATTPLVGYPGINQSFNIMMDGFFAVPTGISVMNGGVPGALVAGTNYFLNTDCAGTTGAFEGITSCLRNSAPVGAGTIDKPVLFATSPTSGYVYSYRGLAPNFSLNSTEVNVNTALIRDIRSGVNGDLVFGVYDGGTNGGYEVMRFDSLSGKKGNVRIGSSGFGTSSIGAGGTLSVAGTIVSGEAEAKTNGTVLLASRFNSTYPTTLNTFGAMRSTGNSVIGFGARPNFGADGYFSTTSQSLVRTGVEVGEEGDNSLFKVMSHGRTTGTGVLNMTELFKVSGLTATFAGFVSSAAGFSAANFFGNASTATRLQTARTINGTAFDGTQNINLTIENSAIRQSSGVSVIGRSANSTGTVADIVAGADDQVLMRSGGVLGFAAIGTNNIANGAVTPSKITGKLKLNYITFSNIGGFSWTAPSNIFSSVTVRIYGGGQGGGGGYYYTVSSTILRIDGVNGRPGGRGCVAVEVAPGTVLSGTIGAGGAGLNTTTATSVPPQGGVGSSTSFMGMVAGGGGVGGNDGTFTIGTFPSGVVLVQNFRSDANRIAANTSKRARAVSSSAAIAWSDALSNQPGEGGSGKDYNQSDASGGIGGAVLIEYWTLE